MVVYIPNPLQCSCLENPVDGGVWWAAVYGVAQSRTRLKRLSSSSSSVYSNSILQGLCCQPAEQAVSSLTLKMIFTCFYCVLSGKDSGENVRSSVDAKCTTLTLAGGGELSHLTGFGAPDWLLRLGPRPQGVMLREVMVHSTEIRSLGQIGSLQVSSLSR